MSTEIEDNWYLNWCALIDLSRRPEWGWTDTEYQEYVENLKKYYSETYGDLVTITDDRIDLTRLLESRRNVINE